MFLYTFRCYNRRGLWAIIFSWGCNWRRFGKFDQSHLLYEKWSKSWYVQLPSNSQFSPPLSNFSYFPVSGHAFKHTQGRDLHICIGLCSPGQRVTVNFLSPFVFDLEAWGRKGQEAKEVDQSEANSALQWTVTRCSKLLEVASTTRVRMPDDAPSSAIGVAQCSTSFATTFSYFEVFIERLGKGDISVGVANQEYPLNLHIGWLKRSYGYHDDDGKKYKWKEDSPGTNEGELYGPPFIQGDTIGCGFDLQTRELYFTKNGGLIGVAFTNVYGILYPSVAISGLGNSVVATFDPPFKYSQTGPSSLSRDNATTNPSQSSGSSQHADLVQEVQKMALKIDNAELPHINSPHLDITKLTTDLAEAISHIDSTNINNTREVGQQVLSLLSRIIDTTKVLTASACGQLQIRVHVLAEALRLAFEIIYFDYVLQHTNPFDDPQQAINELATQAKVLVSTLTQLCSAHYPETSSTMQSISSITTKLVEGTHYSWLVQTYLII